MWKRDGGRIKKRRDCVNSDCVQMSECTCHGEREREKRRWRWTPRLCSLSQQKLLFKCAFIFPFFSNYTANESGVTSVSHSPAPCGPSWCDGLKKELLTFYQANWVAATSTLRRNLKLEPGTAWETPGPPAQWIPGWMSHFFNMRIWVFRRMSRMRCNFLNCHHGSFRALPESDGWDQVRRVHCVSYSS